MLPNLVPRRALHHSALSLVHLLACFSGRETARAGVVTLLSSAAASMQSLQKFPRSWRRRARLGRECASNAPPLFVTELAEAWDSRARVLGKPSTCQPASILPRPHRILLAGILELSSDMLARMASLRISHCTATLDAFSTTAN